MSRSTVNTLVGILLFLIIVWFIFHVLFGIV
jgi:hypothetical protein